MAILVPEPSPTNPMTEDWQAFLFKTTLQGSGFIRLSLTNMNTASEPEVLAGTRFEINGSYFLVEANEPIGGSPAAMITSYIYAVPLGLTAVFNYSSVIPDYDLVKGGWYDGPNRAVAKLIFDGTTGYWNKVILDSEGAINNWNEIAPIPTFGGTLIAEGPINNVLSMIIGPGIYWYELKGGIGGNGGNTAAWAGGIGGVPVAKKGTFAIKNYQLMSICTGGNGNNGGSGTTTNPRYGGGGGASGGSSFIVVGNHFYDECIGGAGGGGAGTSGDITAGGGGGGGAGVPAGTKGADGTGNYFTNGGEGGSINGGIGGGGAANGTAGDNGANLIARKVASDSVYGTSIYRTTYANGGNAGGASNGGTGLQGTSSGYARLYKL